MIRTLLASLLAASSTGLAAAQSDSVVYPPGSQFGVIPPEGFEQANGFTGFMDPRNSASILFSSIDGAQWSDIQELRDPQAWRSQGVTVEELENITVLGRSAFRVSGTQTFQGMEMPKCVIVFQGRDSVALITAQIPIFEPGDDACALIDTISEREPVSMEDQLAALFFSYDRAEGYREVATMAGSSVTLSKGSYPDPEFESPTIIIVNSLASISELTYDESHDSIAFALEMQLSNIDSISVTFSASEPHRVRDSDGADIYIATAEGYTGSFARTDVLLLQYTVVLDSGDYIRAMAIARPDDLAAERETILAMFETITPRVK